MSQFYEYGQEQARQNALRETKASSPQSGDLPGSQQHERLYSYQQQEYQWPKGLEEPSKNYGQQGQQQYEMAVPGLHYFDFGSYEINSRFAAVLSYTALWLTGLLFLLFERKNRFVRFHAMQSLLFFGGVNVLYIFLISIMVNEVPFLWGLAIFAFVVVNVVAFVAWFAGMVGAIRGKYVKLPFVGDIAERYVNRGVTVK
jgi:uncharacterized membrane protein